MIALSSAFKNALIAIDINGKQDFCSLDENSKHAESLLPAIDEMLEENGLNIRDNHSFSIVIGPGSFTGLRIGIALVKGLVQGYDDKAKIYPITSFDLMAYSYIKHSRPENNFTCVINALSGLYFVCSYDKDGKAGQQKLIDEKEFDLLDGEKVGLEEENIMPVLVRPTAEELLELALQMEKEGNYCAYKDIVPVYLRKSQAEDALEQKNRQKI